jgi:hypothetical protein
MFVLVADQSEQKYMTPVRVEFPANGGKPKVMIFKAWFRRLTQAQLDDVNERGAARELLDSDLVSEVMVGWEDVADADGNPAEFNPTNLALLLDIYPVRPTLVKAFFASIKTAAIKN